MHEGPMRRVHQPNDGMVDRAGKAHRLGHGVAVLADIGDLRDLGRVGRIDAEIDPDIALHLARRIARDTYLGGIEVLALGERWNGGAAPIGGEAPAMVKAFELLAVEAPA